MKYLRNELLKKHTSFRIGGPADFFCTAKSAEEIKEAIDFAREKKVPFTVIGAGTNLLVLDAGFRGLVIKLGGGINSIRCEGNIVYAGAGVNLNRLVIALARKGLGGMEFLAGIPGSVGGAVFMNAGAWGRTIGDIIESVTLIDREGKIRAVSGKKLGFGYRKSKLQKSREIVLEAVLKLRKKNKKEISRAIQEILQKRKERHPLGVPNCGSVFKNPKGERAARLIEEAGCKGMRMGDAQVSSRHANFIVNLGDARANDVVRLMAAIQKKVKSRHGIALVPEVKIMVKSTA